MMRRHHFRLLSLILVLVFLARADVGLAESFDQLQARYLSLRNTDVRFSQESVWRDLARDLQIFVRNQPTADNATRALLNAGIIHEELWRNRLSKSDRNEALLLFDSIARDYPGDIFADDALIRAGDILRKEDKDEAEKRYREVAEAYPDGDMVEVAQLKLGDLKIRKKSHIDSKFNINLPVVVVDPGHGGEDLGAQGGGGLNEKDIVLDIAMRLEALASREEAYRVKLTRRTDIFVPLSQRTELTNQANAALFVSLHVNSSPVKTVSGLETYYLDNTDDKSSQALAERENKYFESESGLSDISFILSDLIQSSKMEDSITLANVLQNGLRRHLNQQVGPIKNHGVKRAPFYVLVGTHVPGALVEMFFINNPEEEKLLAQTAIRQHLADGLNLGIKDFLERKVAPRAMPIKARLKR